MRVLIAGADGYLGWPLAQYLTVHGHEVAGVESFFRRRWVEEMGSYSALPICSIEARRDGFRKRFGTELPFWEGNLQDYDLVQQIIGAFAPDAVVHLGECPSAPYSMLDARHATMVQMNNVVGTLNLLFAINALRPDSHFVKLGTMGEYGTPNLDIAEGFFEVEFRGRRDCVPFPRQAGSWYHWSKVHSSNNIMFACELWGLRSTDVMQGVVFGTSVDERVDDERLLTRLDFDQCFGTAINRFCCQAVIGHPLTPYGRGHQKRGFLPLKDSMQCLTLAIEHPPAPGEYRVFNQFAEIYDITELAALVQQVGNELGLEVAVQNVENPRLEAEDHYYRADHQHLIDLGYEPTRDVRSEVQDMLAHLLPYRDRIAARGSVLVPDVHWSGERRRVRFLDESGAKVVAAE